MNAPFHAAALFLFAGALGAAPLNDNIANGQLLTPLAGGSVSATGTNGGATIEAGEFVHPSVSSRGPGKSVWYRIANPLPGSAFNVNTNGSSFNTILSVYRGQAGSGVSQLTAVAGDDDSGSGTQSLVRFVVPEPGQQDYFIAVDGRNGSTGGIVINLIAAPPNDNLSGALPLVPESGSSPVLVNTTEATRQTGEFGFAFSFPDMTTPAKSVWYRIKRPPLGSSFTLDTSGSSFDTVLTLYRGDIDGGVSQLSVIAGSHNVSTFQPYSRISFTVPNSTRQDYFIALDGYNGASGAAKLNWVATPPPGVAPPSTAATTFPASSAEPFEKFTGGADAFDLDGHSITFVPHEVVVNGQTEVHYFYTVRRIQKLPVDLSEAAPIDNTPAVNVPAVTPAGFQIFGKIPATLSAGSAAIGFLDAQGATMIPKIRLLGVLAGFPNQFSALESEIRVLAAGDKTTVQFDYFVWAGSFFSTVADREGYQATCQAEMFGNGMIRLSYLGVDLTQGIVGLSNDAAFPPEDDLSAARLSMKDPVVAESSGNAGFTVALPATQGSALPMVATALPGSALEVLDYTVPAAAASIPAGSPSAVVNVPLTVDATPELAESFVLRLSAPSDPEWIYAEARAWITDTPPPLPAPSPRVTVAGNRVFVLPPPNSGGGSGGFRILSVEGGTLRDPVSGQVLLPGAVISLQTGAAGLLTSGPGLLLQIEWTPGGGSFLGSTTVDLDGVSDSPVFNFAVQTVRATEGGTAELVILSSLAGASVGCEAVSLTAQGSGAGGDFQFQPQALEFTSGRATVSIPILADGLSEGDEEFEVHLVNLSPGAALGPAATARVIISDGGGPLKSPGDQEFPTVSPSGQTARILLPSDLTAQDLAHAWRFAGEARWRAAGSNAWNVRDGFHRIEFNPSAGVDPGFKNLAVLGDMPLFMAPESYLNQGYYSSSYFLDLAYGDFTPAAIPWPSGVTSSPAAGSLVVTLAPGPPSGGGWRRLGQSAWLASNQTEANVPAGRHWIEFKDDVTGYLAPSMLPATVKSGIQTAVQTRYLARPAASFLPVAVPEPKVLTSGLPWQNFPITAQAGKVRVTFEFQPLGTTTDTIVGLSESAAQSFPAYSAMLRANNGILDGWNGTAFGAATSMPFAAGQWYFVEFLVDVANETYGLKVTPPSGAPVTLLSAAGFRAVNVAELRYLSMRSTQGSHTVKNLRVEALSPSSPTWKAFKIPVQKGSFDLGFLFHRVVGAEQIKLGFSNGEAAVPSFELAPLAITIPPDSIAKTAVSIHVDLALDQYGIQNLGGPETVTGPMPVALSQVDHVYVWIPFNATKGISQLTVLDTSFPPHVAAPSGAAPAIESDHWVHVPIEPQTGRFSLTCEVVATGETVGAGDLIDGILGLSDTKATQSVDVAVALQAKLPGTGPGFWNAHSGGPGGTYTRDNDLPVADGDVFTVDLLVDIPNQTFRATLRPENGPPVVVIGAGTFRKPATEIRFLTLRNVQGRLAVSKLRAPLPPPEDAALAFTGQIESGKGFGTGVAVADHAVLTSARLVFDSATQSFIPDVVWRLPAGGSSAVADINEPSGVILITSYAAALLAQPGGGDEVDRVDLAVLAFRPMNFPETANAPALGGFSGFAIDPGAAAWTATNVPKSLASFPMSGIPTGNRSRVHRTDLSAGGFAPLGGNLFTVASGLETPPGSEGAPLFARQTDGRHLPVAICLGAAGGSPRFRAIDSAVASAIYQANQFQRQPDPLQGLNKGGVFFIPTTLDVSTEPNLGHIYSHSIPPEASWTIYPVAYGPQWTTTAEGGDALSVEPATYIVQFSEAPAGFAINPAITFNGPLPRSLRKSVARNPPWHLPEVYVRTEPTRYDAWLAANYREDEQARSAVVAPDSMAPWLGIDNVVAYAFGFDPKGTLTRPADPEAMIPGYPVLRRQSPGGEWSLEFLRRRDPDLTYLIETTGSLDGTWPGSLNATYTASAAQVQVIATAGVWDRVRCPLTSLPGGPGRKFVRVRVELDESAP